MSVTPTEQLAREILEAVEQPGQFKNWLQQKSESASEEAQLNEAFVLTTEELLGADPPQAAEWEQLLIQLAVHTQQNNKLGLSACKAVLNHVREMFDGNRFERVEQRKILTIAGALTVALTAQRKLRQPIEVAIKSLCESSHTALGPIGQQCQNIWKRKGQMSGERGLFCWDTRNCEWRLTQDFKAYQPDS